MVKPQDLYRMVRDEIGTGHLVLPTLPDVAIRIGKIVSGETADAGTVADEVAHDPAIASRLLAVANSVSIRGAGPAIGTLRAAIARLGFGLTRVLVSQMALKQLFFAQSPAFKQIMQDTWSRSLEVAAMSQVLAAPVKLSGETAMLAGLVHQVGVLPVAKLLDRHPSLIRDPVAAKQAIAMAHPYVARLVLMTWKFPEELVDVPQAAFDFTRVHDGPADYADLVSVSILLTGASEDVDRATVPAFAKIGLDPQADSAETSWLQEAYDRNLELLGVGAKARG